MDHVAPAGLEGGVVLPVNFTCLQQELVTHGERTASGKAAQILLSGKGKTHSLPVTGVEMLYLLETSPSTWEAFLAWPFRTVS